MTSLSRRHRTSLTAICAARAVVRAIAIVVLVGQAAAWVHESATPHVTCLEHGEQVHLTTQGLVAAAPRQGTGLAVEPAPTAETAAHAHDHCGLQGQRTTSVPAPARALVSAPLAVSTAPAVPNVGPGLLLLRLAPKTSPPRTPVV